MEQIYMYVGAAAVWAAGGLVALILLYFLVQLIRHPICAAILTYHLLKRGLVKRSIRAKQFWQLRVLLICTFKHGFYDSKITYYPEKDATNQGLLIIDFQKFIPHKIQ